MMKSWAEYFELSKNRGPNPILENALKLVVERQHALDLGAGSLKDSKFMLSVGFEKVTAIDAEPASRKYRCKIPTKQLAIQIKTFEGLKLKPNTYNFISAQYALPFTSPPHLPALIKQIQNSLKPNGIFCAQFFGINDDWSKTEKQITFVKRSELKTLLQPLDTIYFKEKKFLGKTIDNTAKNWHLFEIIAIKTPTIIKA